MKQVIKVTGLTKAYKNNVVLKNVNFSVNEGQILALLGPNGAGKTTTVKILATLLRADDGEATVSDYDVHKDGDKVRESIGLTGQFAAVDELLTGRENVAMIAQLYNMPADQIDGRVDELIKEFDLVDAADRLVRTYSGGMKRRLDLAMSLVAEPKVLFLDEPTTGLDPRSRLVLWEFVKKLSAAGMTILLTTQYMEEAEYLADNVIVLDHGTIIAEGTVNELKSKAGSAQVEVVMKNSEDAEKAMKLFKTKTHHEATDSFAIPAPKAEQSLSDAIDKLKKAGLKVDTIGLRKPTLDDVFLALTGREAEEKSETKKGDEK